MKVSLSKLMSMAVVAMGVALLGATAAEAACKQGFCTKGYDRDGRRWVDFTTSLSGYTHFNVFNGSTQIELGRNERSFQVFYKYGSNPKKYLYKIQACNSGGVLSSSSCSPWASFTHTAKN